MHAFLRYPYGKGPCEQPHSTKVIHCRPIDKRLPLLRQGSSSHTDVQLFKNCPGGAPPPMRGDLSSLKMHENLHEIGVTL